MNERAISQIMNGVSTLGLAAVRFRALQLEKICESPIEVMLGTAILVADHLECFAHDRLVIARQTEEWPADRRLLIPQYRVDCYRADFAYVLDGKTTLIECDGHDFHERTKHQATRDKQRDRSLQLKGYPVLRFTGSEIFADPVLCAVEVMEFVWSALDQEPKRA